MHARTGLPILAALAGLCGCSLFRGAGLAEEEPDRAALADRAANSGEPSHVVIQHVLIGFDEAGLPGVTRTKTEAERLAARVLADAKAGRDFGELVRLYSDDAGSGGSGIYAMANWGVPAGAEESERRKMVRGFGGLAFSLAPGEIGVVEYDANASPFGWHVMKRLR